MRDKFINEQKKKLQSGGIDRRQFIMTAAAAGLALPSAMRGGPVILDQLLRWID